MFTTNTSTWADSVFGFKNVASTTSNSGTNFVGSEPSTIQHAATNRCLGIRQTAGVAGGDPGAAFALQIQNTAGLGNFQLALDFNMLSVQGRSTIWTVDYGVGVSPSNFILVGTYEDPGVYGRTTKSFSFGTGVENRNEPVWIRVVALTAAGGTGSRDTCAIDNVSLSYAPFVGTAPGISSHPQDVNTVEGGSAVFSVEVQGSPPFGYQWLFDSSPILHATDASLVLSNITFGMAGSYAAIVSNAYGSVTSSIAQLTVQPAPPVITVTPQNTSAPLGSNALFTVVVSGTPPFDYQWSKDGATISGATNSFLSLTNISQNDAGDYVVFVSNAGGSTSSVPAKLTISINTVALMTYNVKGNGVADFGTNTVQVQALGRQLIYLQPDIVTFNEIPASKTFEVTNIVRQYLPGYYWATNSGTDGYIRSAIVSRWPITRSERWLFNSSLTNFGYEGRFTRDLFEAEIAVPGFGDPLHVFTAHLKSGSDNDSSSRRAAEAGAVSNYFVNGFLTTNGSRPYVLTGDLNEDVARPPNNSQQPIETLTSAPTGLRLTTPRNPMSNDERTFSVQSLPLQRRYDYILPSGVLFSNILESQVFRSDLLSPVPPGLESTDSPNAADHLPVLVVFNSPYVERALYITSQPASRTNNAGTTATFSVQADGDAPFSFQWFKDGTHVLSDGGNIWGATSSNLVISSVGQGDVGSYSVLVSNESTNLLSSAASLAVIIPPQVVLHPGPFTVQAGTTMNLISGVSLGSAPLSFQWQFAGTDIPGATNQTLTRANMQLSDAGGYSVSVSNLAGSDTAHTIVRVTSELAGWNFNSVVPDTNSATGNLDPSAGTGSAELIGATASSFAAGVSSDPSNSGGDNSGWNTSGYPAQGTGNKTAGVQFRCSTVGWENITISWEQRASATASRYYQFQFSTNGVDFIDFGPAIEVTADSVFQYRRESFWGYLGVADNPNFAFRIVSQWESSATGGGGNSFVGTSSSYSTGGTVRFDLVSVKGQPIVAAPSLAELQIVNGQLQFGIGEPVAFPVMLQSSTNLVDWLDVQRIYPPVVFVETNIIGSQFFRVAR